MKHEWRTVHTNIAEKDLSDTLEHCEDQGFEVYAIIPREGDNFLIVMRAPSK